MGFKSGDCAGQDISWRTSCSSLLKCASGRVSKYALGHYLASLTHKLRSKLERVMLQYAVITGLIQFSIQNKSLTLRFVKALHTITEPALCFTIDDIKGYSSFTNSSPHRDSPIWTKDFKLWLVSLNDFFPMLYCSVFVRLGLLETFWHSFASLTVVSWLQFCYIGQFQ